MSIAARSVLRESMSDAAPSAQAAPSDDQDFWREKVQKLEKEAKERHRSARACDESAELGLTEAQRADPDCTLAAHSAIAR